MSDPTYQEMVDFIRSTGIPIEGEADMAEGIYYFATHNHGGQGTNLYEAIDLCGFVPGPIAVLSSESVASMVYEYLQGEFLKLAPDKIDQLLLGTLLPVEDRDLYDRPEKEP